METEATTTSGVDKRKLLNQVVSLTSLVSNLYLRNYTDVCRATHRWRDMPLSMYQAIIDMVVKYHGDIKSKLEDYNWEIALLVHKGFRRELDKALLEIEEQEEDGREGGTHGEIKSVLNEIHESLRKLVK